MNKWHGNPWAVLLTLSLGFLMTLIDLTIVNIAIPSMMDQLDASLDHVLWVINAYALALAVLLITAGRLGDLRGQRNLFITGVAIFTLASLACGLAQTPSQLIAARVVQGVGAAALMPQTMAIIVATFPAQRRGTALGIWGGVAGLATVIGPTLGGLLVSAAGWRWIFLINIPIGIFVLAASFVLIPDNRLQRRHRFDWVGVALATTALFCIAFGLTEGQRYAWNGWIWGLLAAGLLLVGVFLAHQRTRQDAEPLVPFALFRDRNFAIMNFVGAAVSVSILGFFIIITVYLQAVLGYSALKAGLVLATASVLSTLVAPMAGRLADRWGGKFILAGGLVLFAVGAAWISAIADVGTPWPAFQAPLVVLGAGMGFVFAPMVTEAMRGIPPALAGAASGLINTIRQVGAVLGSAAVGALLQSRLAAALQDQAAARAGEIPEAYRGPFLAGFENAGHHGLEAGGRPALDLPVPDVPAAVAARLERVGTAVFQHGFVDALPWTLALPIVVILIAALTCLGMTRHRRGPEADRQPDATPTTTAA